MTVRVTSSTEPVFNFKKWLEKRNDPTWLKNLRERAWDRSQALAWTSPSPEAWKAVQPTDWEWTTLTDSTEMASKTFTKQAAPEGLTLLPLMEAVHHSEKNISEKIRRELDRLLHQRWNHRWWLTCFSFFDSGWWMCVPEGKHVEWAELPAPQEGRLPLTLVHLEPGSSARLLESLDENGPSIQALSVHVSEKSKLERFFLQTLPQRSRILLFREATIDREAILRTAFLCEGGGAVRIDEYCDLVGEGAEVHQNGLVVGDQHQILECVFQQNHSVERTTSDLMLRTVLGGEALGVFNGQIDILPDAKRSQAEQTNHNLLLSTKARALTFPKLEIGTDNVQCKHGATVSAIDEKQLFYLTSRGLPRRDAMKLIVQGYFADLVDRLPSDALKEKIQALLVTKLDGMLESTPC